MIEIHWNGNIHLADERKITQAKLEPSSPTSGEYYLIVRFVDHSDFYISGPKGDMERMLAAVRAAMKNETSIISIAKEKK